MTGSSVSAVSSAEPEIPCERRDMPVFSHTIMVLSDLDQGGKEGSITENISQGTRETRPKSVLLRELEQYDSMGIPLYLDGKRRSPRSIARACMLAECGGYMRDYREDKEGRIKRVDFNYIPESMQNR